MHVRIYVSICFEVKQMIQTHFINVKMFWIFSSINMTQLSCPSFFSYLFSFHFGNHYFAGYLFFIFLSFLFFSFLSIFLIYICFLIFAFDVKNVIMSF